MNTQTPFARLGYIEKSAGLGSELGWTAADIGVGSIPVVGSVWNAGRGIYNATQGKWGEAAGNLLGVGLGLFGLGGAAAAAKGVATAGKLGMAARAANGIATAAKGTGAMASGARGLMAGGKALSATNNMAGQLIGTTGLSAKYAQPLGNMAVESGLQGVVGMLPGTAAPTAPAIPAGPRAPSVGNAPSWYSAITGNANVPDMTAPNNYA